MKDNGIEIVAYLNKDIFTENCFYFSKINCDHEDFCKTSYESFNYLGARKVISGKDNTFCSAILFKYIS